MMSGNETGNPIKSLISTSIGCWNPILTLGDGEMFILLIFTYTIYKNKPQIVTLPQSGCQVIVNYRSRRDTAPHPQNEIEKEDLVKKP